MLKHLSQAMVLLSEAARGYPEHRWLAVGHLAEAEEESIAEWPDLAASIRDDRLAVMQGDNVDLLKYLGGHQHISASVFDDRPLLWLTVGVALLLVITKKI